MNGLKFTTLDFWTHTSTVFVMYKPLYSSTFLGAMRPSTTVDHSFIHSFIFRGLSYTWNLQNFMRLSFQNMPFARHSPQLATFHVTKKWHALNRTSLTRKFVSGHKTNLTMNHDVLLALHFCPSLWHCHIGVWWATAAGLSFSPSTFPSDWSFRCTRRSIWCTSKP